MKYLIIKYLIETVNLDELKETARDYDDSESFFFDYLSYIVQPKIKQPFDINSTIEIGDVLSITIGKDKKFYKTVISNKRYSNWNHWDFLIDNLQEFKVESDIIYKDNKDKPKKDFNPKGKVVKVYHASPYKFNEFKEGVNKTSGQFGADIGFFFVFDKSKLSVLDDNLYEYIYTVDVDLGNHIVVHGDDLGVGQGRFAQLVTLSYDYDTVTIKDGNTGFGIMDELVVFDYNNIDIKNIELNTL